VTVSFQAPVSDTAAVWRGGHNDPDARAWLPVELTEDPPGRAVAGSLDASDLARVVYVIQAVDTRGNVTWLEYQVSEPEEMPSSGVEKEIPLPVEIGSVDLAVTVDDGQTSVVPGTTLTYSVVVTSAAEGLAVAGARVEDRFGRAVVRLEVRRVGGSVVHAGADGRGHPRRRQPAAGRVAEAIWCSARSTRRQSGRWRTRRADGTDRGARPGDGQQHGD
jgi:hypothetical protein